MDSVASIVRPGPGRLVAIAVGSLLGVACTLTLPWLLGQTIDAVVGGRGSLRFVLLTVGLIAVAVGSDLATTVVSTRYVAGTTAHLRLRLVRHLLSVSPAGIRRFTVGDLVTRLCGNSADAAQAATSAVAAGIAVIPALGSLVLLALIDGWMALTLLAGIGVVALLLRNFTRNAEGATAAYQRVQADIATRLTESLAGIRTIMAANTVSSEEDRVLQPMSSLSAYGIRMWRVLARTSAQAALVGPVIVVAVLAVGGLALAGHRISAGELFAAGRYASMGAGLGALTGVLGVFARAGAAARRVGEVLNLPPTTYGDRALPPASNGTLEFRDVRVGQLLHDINLVVPSGASVAVVGRSGSGKSTLAEIAARLREPDAGQVLLGGVALRDLRHDQLREAVGCAFERPALYGATIGEAIGPQRPHSVVRQAAQAVEAEGFIARLPSGFRTPLDRAPMSGGERQRLGLARAWPATRLLVLDDAMSSLDMVTEMKISQALLGDASRRTRLIVSHRIATAHRADLVVWLEEGRVRAVGSHQDLWNDLDYRAVFS